MSLKIKNPKILDMRMNKQHASLALFTLALFALPAEAAILNLTTSTTANGSIGQCIGGIVDTCGTFFVTNDQSTGTGVIDPFYTVQANGEEKGFNSDVAGNSPNYDMKRGSGTGFTKAIQVSDFGLVDINGNVCNLCATPYIRFLLDMHEAEGNNAEFLSIDVLQLYVKSFNDLVSTKLGEGTAAENLQTGATKIYDLDGLNDNVILADSRLNSGSGSGDMLFYVPFSAFAGHESDWLYLYGEYGKTGTISNPSVGCNSNNANDPGVKDCNYDSSATYEEWARIDAPGGSVVPEPTHLILTAAGALALFLTDYRRRRRNKLV